METQIVQLTEQEEQKLQTAGELVTEATALVVTDPQSHTVGSEFLVQIQTKIREIEDIRDYQLEPIKAAKRNIEISRKRTIEFFENRGLVSLREIQQIVDRRLVTWRRAERRKAELEAEKKRAAELKKIESARKKTEKVAEGLEKKGLNEDAAAIRDKEAVRPAPAPIEVKPRIAVVKGANVKIVKKSEVNEPRQAQILATIIDAWNAKADPEFQMVPASYWQLNTSALDAFGAKTDGQIAVPGVRWVEDESTMARRRR